MRCSSARCGSGVVGVSRRSRLAVVNGAIGLSALLLAFVMSGCSDSESALEQNEDTAKSLVHSSAIIISETVQTMTNEQQRIDFIRTFIDPIRFYADSSGYFYVYNFDCVNIAHATQKNLVGQNLYDYTDSQGKYVIRELAAAAADGGGFVEYYWVKPGEAGEKLKIGYVEPIPGTDYFIGTGVYLE